MWIVKADHADEPYVLAPITVTDSEGNPVLNPLIDIELASDDPGGTEPIPDADPHTGMVHFGGPNLDGSEKTVTCSATYRTPDRQGKMLAIKTGVFVVTAGDPDKIQGGDFTLPGLPESP